VEIEVTIYWLMKGKTGRGLWTFGMIADLIPPWWRFTVFGNPLLGLDNLFKKYPLA